MGHKCFTNIWIKTEEQDTKYVLRNLFLALKICYEEYIGSNIAYLCSKHSGIQYLHSVANDEIEAIACTGVLFTKQYFQSNLHVQSDVHKPHWRKRRTIKLLL